MTYELRTMTDDWMTEIIEQPDGQLLVTITANGRSWKATRASVEDAVGVAHQIRCEQETIP